MRTDIRVRGFAGAELGVHGIMEPGTGVQYLEGQRSWCGSGDGGVLLWEPSPEKCTPRGSDVGLGVEVGCSNPAL